MTLPYKHANPSTSAWKITAVRWAEDPLTSVVAASGAIIGSFGLVLSGIGVIHLVTH
ncbi:MAG: hypothetical protein AAGA91_12700 [Pseudomonadota bacterium]